MTSRLQRFAHVAAEVQSWKETGWLNHPSFPSASLDKDEEIKRKERGTICTVHRAVRGNQTGTHTHTCSHHPHGTCPHTGRDVWLTVGKTQKYSPEKKCPLTSTLVESTLWSVGNVSSGVFAFLSSLFFACDSTPSYVTHVFAFPHM